MGAVYDIFHKRKEIYHRDPLIHMILNDGKSIEGKEFG
jgi:hypothetical protein